MILETFEGHLDPMFIAFNKVRMQDSMSPFLGCAIWAEMAFQDLHAAIHIRSKVYNGNARPGRSILFRFEERSRQHYCLAISGPARNRKPSPPTGIEANRCACQGFHGTRFQ